MKTEDGHIIDKCLNGEPEAFGFLVDKYKACIYAFAYSKLGNFHDAEDVAQEVFTEAFKRLSTLRRWDSFLVWLYSMTSNICKMKIRTHSRRIERSIKDEDYQNAVINASMSSFRESLLDESLHDALNHLSETYRQVLTLYYLGGMDTEQIAEFLRVSPTAIRQRLSRARAELREEFCAMMSNAFEYKKLQSAFTFRIVEAIKRIRINPITKMSNLPYGISMALGLLIALVGMNHNEMVLNMVEFLSGSPLPSDSRTFNIGEIPIDIIKSSDMMFIASNQEPNKENKEGFKDDSSYFLAPQAGKGKWSTMTGMITPRMYIASSVVDGKMYVFGGSNNMVDSSAVEEYDPKTDKWTKKADMPTARDGLSTCVLNGKIYVIGGAPFGGAAYSKVEVYDPKKDEWTEKASMNNKRWCLATCALNGKIYAFGGGAFWDAGVAIKTVEVYDPEKDIWIEKGKMPNPRGVIGSGVIANNKIYLIGGGASRFGPFFSSVDEYDPETDTWKQKADMPTARGALVTLAINNKIYAIGGTNSFFGPYFSVVEVYDPETDTWSNAGDFSDMPTKRCLFSANVIDGKVYAVGGALSPMVALTTLEVFDPEVIIQQSIDSNGKKKVTWGSRK